MLADPIRAHIIRVVVGRVADFGQPKLAGGDLPGDVLSLRPLRVIARRVGLAVTGEGELAALLQLALIDDAADRLREERASHPVHDDLADGDLAADRLAARLEIDGGGETAALALLELGLALALIAEVQALGVG